MDHSKGESVSEFVWIDINTLYNGGFQFFQTGLISKVLEAAGVEYFNVFPTPTKVKATLETDANGFDAKRDWSNSYSDIDNVMKSFKEGGPS